MAKEKRVEILFEPTDYERLQEAAKMEGQSVGAIVREAVAQYVASPTPEKRHKAFLWLTSQDDGPMPDWEDLKHAMGRTQFEAIVKGMDLPPDYFDE